MLRRPRARREIALVLAPLALCPLVARLAPGDPAGAIARGAAIADFERGLGLFVEPALHRGAQSWPVLVALANVVYLAAHVPALFGALVLAWHRAPTVYRRARTVFVTAQTLTVGGYVMFPTAPPRLVPGLGFPTP